MTSRLVASTLAAAAAACALIAPATATAAPSCGATQQIAAADAYIAALGDRRKAADVPFARHAVRYENGLQTGFSGEQMRHDLDLHLQYSVMDAPIVTDRQSVVGGNPDLLRYKFIVPVVIAGAHLVDAPTVETFVIPRATCLISRIDATISMAAPGHR